MIIGFVNGLPVRSAAPQNSEAPKPPKNWNRFVWQDEDVIPLEPANRAKE